MILKNKVVFVSGGGGLLGSEFVNGIIEEGGIAIIGDIDSKLAEATHDRMKIKGKTDSYGFVQVDITDADSIQQAIKVVVNKYGNVDALVNSAYPRNKSYGQDLLSIKYNDFCENVNMHLGGYFQISQLFAQYFLSQGWGNIINLASIYGIIAPRFEIYRDTTMTTPIEYAVIKSGVIQMTKYFAKYFKGNNIKINSLSPGGILNDQPELFIKAYDNYCINKGMLDKNDVVGALIFLLSDMSKYINGQNIIVDDGFTL
jgi:NAD(P)-dependent dehydrogenase (short-subunit alcohol dehydrogenase family)